MMPSGNGGLPPGPADLIGPPPGDFVLWPGLAGSGGWRLW